MPSNNRNAQNKILAQKAKAERAKSGEPKNKKGDDEELSKKAKENRERQHANNEKKRREREKKKKAIEKAGGKAKYEAAQFEKFLADHAGSGMKLSSKKKKTHKKKTVT